ncbi:MAG: hypothetical protein SF187_15280 [Deltaproteobacteria bacterium]|nr:hypothetical protein [Deltaproteobacteria bacterium]
MKFRIGLALSACASVLLLGGCSSGGGTSDENQGGEGGGGGGGDSGGNAGGDAGSSSSSGGGKGGTATSQGGGGGADDGGSSPGSLPLLTKAVNDSNWGEGFKVAVPPGVVILPGGTQYIAGPKFAKPLPVWSGMSRTMNLLKSSTADKRNTVKILFYGQSITRQEWFVTVTDELKKQFPNADIQTWMLAAGGMAADRMRRASEHDVIPLYPDLIIYQNYGGYTDIDGILQDWRSRTTAEIIIQNWHLGSDAGNAGVDRMSYLFIPDVARRLGAEFLDSRTAFKEYIAAKNLSNTGLTGDGIHLNAEGMTVMAKLHVDLFKNYPAATVTDPLAMVNTFEVGKDVKWNGGTLAFEFEGNRVDLIVSNGSMVAAEAATILVDGKKPSEFPGNYAFTRPNGDGKNINKPEPGWPWTPGAVMRVDSMAARVVEDWTLKITNRNGSNFSFTVEGSVTGPDGGGMVMGANGTGTGTTSFVSNSKRVVIKPSDWQFEGAMKEWNLATNQVVWKSIALSTDVFPPKAVNASDSKIEYAVTLFQGLPNGKHKVEIKTKDGKSLPLASVRTFRPPLKL